MTSAAAHDPLFSAVTAAAFERNLIADLAAGRCAAIRVPGLVSRSFCEETMRALERVQFATYGTERVNPPVMRFGVGVSDHRDQGRLTDSYWDQVTACHQAWNGLGLGFDPFAECRAQLGKHWPHPVSVARRGGRELAPGVAREPNQGFRVHYDDALREFAEDLLDDNLVAQFAFNLYLSVPEQGGETVVWRHRWDPADEEHRLPKSYGYAESVVQGAESFELKPEVGEALLFNPRNFHAVRPSRDARRMALGFSLAMSDTGELLCWG